MQLHCRPLQPPACLLVPLTASCAAGGGSPCAGVMSLSIDIALQVQHIRSSVRSHPRPWNLTGFHKSDRETPWLGLTITLTACACMPAGTHPTPPTLQDLAGPDEPYTTSPHTTHCALPHTLYCYTQRCTLVVCSGPTGKAPQHPAHHPAHRPALHVPLRPSAALGLQEAKGQGHSEQSVAGRAPGVDSQHLVHMDAGPTTQLAHPTHQEEGQGTGRGSQAHCPGPASIVNWLGQDCNATLSLERVDDSRWCWLELGSC
ncbi:hypothetical protein V8C86DRAFT_2671853 [Haematococcus lacustris]